MFSKISDFLLLTPASEKEALKQEAPKIRADLSVSIFEQLTLPVRDGQPSSSEQKINIQQSETETIVNSSDAASEINVCLIAKC